MQSTTELYGYRAEDMPVPALVEAEREMALAEKRWSQMGAQAKSVTAIDLALARYDDAKRNLARAQAVGIN